MEQLEGHVIDFLDNRGVAPVYKMGPYVDEPRGKVRHAAFSNKRYSTDDPRMARLMIEAEQFNVQWGYYVDTAGLPEVVAKKWSKLGRGARQTVLLRLVDGKSEDEALQGIEETEADATSEPTGGVIKVEGQNKWICPGCGLVAKGKTKRHALSRHFTARHPELPSEQLLAE